MNYSKHYVTTLLLSVLVVAVIGTPAKAGDPLADKLGPGSGRASCGDQGQVTDPPFLKPDWWNDSDCGLVNFAYWEDLSGDGPWTPPDDPTHFCGWASATEFEISQTSQ